MRSEPAGPAGRLEAARRWLTLTPGPRSYDLVFWLLATIALPVWETVTGRAQPTWLATTGLVAFALCYLATVRIGFGARGSGRTTAALALALTALTIGLLAAFDSGGWYTLIILPSLACAIALRAANSGNRVGVALLAAVAASMVGVGWLQGVPAGALASIGSTTFMAGLVTWVILRLVSTIHELRAARDELAVLAVEEERLRFARDLHDLLAHTLSLIVVKSEVVRRLARTDPDAAAEQAADIETVGRRALAEVREAVAGYRDRPDRSLRTELDGARSALATAGIELVLSESGPPLPSPVAALAGWVVREGVTNVLRHSAASRCQIDVHHADGRTVLEIRDDGTGRAAGGDPAGRGDPAGGRDPAGGGDPAGRGGDPGGGLCGLADRLAPAGGRLESGNHRDGGFGLRVELPDVPTAHPTGSAVAESAGRGTAATGKQR